MSDPTNPLAFGDAFNPLFLSRRAEPEEDILEILRSMEEMDEESFPYYTLVRWLRCSIEDHLEDVISSEVTGNSETWKAAARDVYNNIIESPHMATLLENIRKGMDPNESLSNAMLHMSIVPSREPSRQSMYDSESSIDDAWWNQAVLPQQYQQIAEDISSRKALSTRIESLKVLDKAHLSDAVGGPHWIQLRRGLKEAICDENEEAFLLGLKIHSKLLASSSVHIATKEAFLNLVEALSTQFMSRKLLPHLPTFESGIDLEIPLISRIVRILTLIFDAQKEMPKEWIRFSTRKVEEMIENYVDLLAMHTYDGVSRDKILYPFHLLAVMDPKASWSRRWSHGLFSRSLLFRALARSSPLIRYMADGILMWMETFDISQYMYVKTSQQNLQVTPPIFQLSGELVEYCVFFHSIYIIQSLVHYKDGRSLFPLTSPQASNKITIHSLAVSAVEFLNSHSEEIGDYGPVALLVKFVITILKEPKIQIQSSLLLAILQPILEAHADKSQEATYPLQNHTIKLVEVLVSTADGFRSLIGGRKPRGSFRQRNTNENPGCLARTIADYMTAVLKNHENADTKLINSLLSICSKMQLSHEVFLYLEPSGLFQVLNNFYSYLKSSMELDMLSSCSKTANRHCTLLSGLIRCYPGILKTPKGMFIVNKAGILYDVVQDLFENSLVSWIRPSDRCMLSQACYYAAGAKAVREERMMAELLMKVWQSSEGSVEQRPGVEREQEEIAKESITILASVCCSLTSVEAHLSERTGSAETLLALQCGPCSLPQLLETILMGDEEEEEQEEEEQAAVGMEEEDEEKVEDIEEKEENEEGEEEIEDQGLGEENAAESYAIPPPANLVLHTGLSLLCHLVACPDTALVLQHKFNLQEQLLQQQRENVVSDENNAIVIDELTLLRNHILVQISVVGGPTERVLPPPSMPLNGEFTWPLFGCTPVPKDYILRIPARSLNKRQGELQKFLSDTRPGVHDAQWLVQCRKAARMSMAQSADEIRGLVLLDAIEQVLRASSSSSSLPSSPGRFSPDLIQLFPEDLLGIRLSIRYGIHLRLIQSSTQTQDNLSQLLKFARSLEPMESEEFSGFDWLTATVFIILCGNMDRSRSFLHKLANLKSSPVLWPALAERRKLRPQIEATLSHLVELLLGCEAPQILVAFQRSGVSPGSLAVSWVRRSFWGILDWSGITQWLLLACVSEPDFCIFLCVALLMHQQAKIVRASACGRLLQVLKVQHMKKFNVGEAAPLIERLTKRHKLKVLPHLQASLGRPNSS